ncbi:Dyp-type peroxidase [uncultured Leifsonia sp.]|uniref:Dyp-type peroxidase n=1 Tax=uncultured Leifsonia sp. TaxID=340359 RepID=UPI0028D3138D|nr:Dyp-type peroxidase [uncultured Leifsonia sp.]
MTADAAANLAQATAAPLGRHAIFLTVTVRDTSAAYETVRGTLADVSDTVKSVGFRDRTADLTCVTGISASAWPPLTGRPLPKELHPFQEIQGRVHTAVTTPGDLLFHIRADRQDLCFELERQILATLRGAVDVVDETTAFRYFDTRDLLGFVDGTANPVGREIANAILVDDEDPDFRGGSYIVTQKYLHNIDAWSHLTTEQQETIIGRTKADDIELPDATSGQRSHKTLSTITDDAGNEYPILRDNMPFGRPGADQFGTYFIGYSARLWVIERMLERMFIGDPPGAHDRILDFSTAATGNVFFAPARELLDSLDDSPAGPTTDDISLGLGALRA